MKRSAATPKSGTRAKTKPARAPVEAHLDKRAGISPSARPPAGPRVALTLGTLLHNWPADRRRDFYFRIADEAPVDTVCLGEVVCAKWPKFTANKL